MHKVLCLFLSTVVVCSRAAAYANPLDRQEITSASETNLCTAVPGFNTGPVMGMFAIVIPMIDYEPIPLPRLIGTAELAVIGHVDTVRASTFTFQVDDVLIDTICEHVIDVVKFVPTPFDSPRAAPYRRGQQFMLLLFKDTTDQDRTRWRIYGIGGEGEMPIDSNYVYFQGRFIEGLKRESYLVHGVTRKIQRYTAEVFAEAVRDYKKCFKWHLPPGERRPIPEQICDEAALELYRVKSTMHDYLVRETLKQLGN